MLIRIPTSLYLSCEYVEIQARLTGFLGLHRTSSRVSLISIASFVENANTRKAYRQFCKNLHDIGITEDTIVQKEQEILGILQSHSIVANSQIDQSQLQGAGCFYAETSFYVTTNFAGRKRF